MDDQVEGTEIDIEALHLSVAALEDDIKSLVQALKDSDRLIEALTTRLGKLEDPVNAGKRTP